MENPAPALGARFSELYSTQSSARLALISGLRSRGIGEHISLPQLVVCGDQSTGKSSVLEGITEIPFPRQDGLCTRFATEITLEHTDGEMQMIATIIPAISREGEMKKRLSTYERCLDDFADLPLVIGEVGELMGLRGYGSVASGPSFGRDTLRIKVTGKTGLNITIVDLPGIISVPNEEQTDDDVDAVHAIADEYAANPRTILLAVVQAGNDISNQPIIRKSKIFDKAGERTIGVITKPDLINDGTQSRLVALARNKDRIKLRLGFFLVKNPSPTELASGASLGERDEKERKYFTSPPWSDKGLDSTRVGVRSLRHFLHDLLDRHTERELPQVRDEVRALLRATEKDIESLGEERPTPAHIRMYLSRLAMRFHALTTSALHGDYHGRDVEFFSTNTERWRRLRAHIHSANTQFSEAMRLRGQTLHIASGSTGKVTHPGEQITESSKAGHSIVEKVTEQLSTGSQLSVTETEFKDWVKQVYATTRGRELPGNYNHVLLTELFHLQSKRWSQLARSHLEFVVQNLKAFILDLCVYITVEDDKVGAEINENVNRRLSECHDRAARELEALLEDERQHPITYNHYYTDNVQKARQQGSQLTIQQLFRDATREDYNGNLHISNNPSESARLIGALQKRVTVDMDDQACSEARAGLDAYYKVARKTFVDNACKQVIERHLLRPLNELFSPETVAGLSEDELVRMASESPQSQLKRADLRSLQSSLLLSLKELSE